MELKNKNIIYLGGFGGIGQKCIEEFLKKAIQSLIIFDLREDSQILKHLQDSYKSCKIHYIPIDVTKSESIEEAFKHAKEKLDYIDIVVNGCGLMNDTHLDLTIDINLRGVIQSSMTALNYMDKSKGGRGGCIVNISSHPLNFHHTGVNFVTICPGLTDTALLHDIKDKTTLRDYSGPMVEIFLNIKQQSADACAQNLVKAVENNKLGSVWLLDLGELTEIEIPSLWMPTMINN